MPNIVTCELVVEGNRGLLDAFYRKNRGKKKGAEEGSLLSFERAVPYPDEWTDKQKYGDVSFFPKDETGADNWYSWCPKHWGTKWDAMSVSVERDEDRKRLTYHFQTAWSPPTPWFMRACTKILEEESCGCFLPGFKCKLEYADEMDEMCENEGKLVFVSE